MRGGGSGVGRRQFLGYVLAAPTLVVAAKLGKDALTPHAAGAAVPSPPEPSDLMDLGDLLTLAAAPTSGLIAIQLNADGTASFALPRAEVGQGITTSVAMLIAEELDLPLDKVRVTLADARPELAVQPVDGRVEHDSLVYTPVRTAAAVARQRLPSGGSDAMEGATAVASTKAGLITVRLGQARHVRDPGQDGRRVEDRNGVGHAQAGRRLRRGRHAAEPHRRTRRRHRPQEVRHGPRRPGRAPTMVCRPPTINGTVRSVAQPRRGPRDAGHHRRRGGRRPAWPCGRRRSASASTRCGPSTCQLGPGPDRRRVRRDACSQELRNAELPLRCPRCRS